MAMPAPIDDRVREAISRPMTVVDITTAGRKSGEPRRLEIVLHNIDGHLYISGQPSRRRRSWLANLDGNPNLTIHLKRGVKADLPATAREITERLEHRQALEAIARNWQRGDAGVIV